MTLPALTDEQKAQCDSLVTGELLAHHQLALASSMLDGHPCAVIVAVIPMEDDSGEAKLVPLAVLIDDAIFARLYDPVEDINEDFDRNIEAELQNMLAEG